MRSAVEPPLGDVMCEEKVAVGTAALLHVGTHPSVVVLGSLPLLLGTNHR